MSFSLFPLTPILITITITYYDKDQQNSGFPLLIILIGFPFARDYRIVMMYYIM